MRKFFGRIGSEQDVETMHRMRCSDEELKGVILYAINDLHIGRGLLLKQTYR